MSTVSCFLVTTIYNSENTHPRDGTAPDRVGVVQQIIVEYKRDSGVGVSAAPQAIPLPAVSALVDGSSGEVLHLDIVPKGMLPVVIPGMPKAYQTRQPLSMAVGETDAVTERQDEEGRRVGSEGLRISFAMARHPKTSPFQPLHTVNLAAVKTPEPAEDAAAVTKGHFPPLAEGRDLAPGRHLVVCGDLLLMATFAHGHFPEYEARTGQTDASPYHRWLEREYCPAWAAATYWLSDLADIVYGLLRDKGSNMHRLYVTNTETYEEATELDFIKAVQEDKRKQLEELTQAFRDASKMQKLSQRNLRELTRKLERLGVKPDTLAPTTAEPTSGIGTKFQ